MLILIFWMSHSANPSGITNDSSYSSRANHPGIGRTVCRCGYTLRVQTSSTDGNCGRRFMACPLRGDTKCRFYTWVNPEFPDQAVEVINELRRKAKRLEARVAKGDSCPSHMNDTVDRFEGLLASQLEHPTQLEEQLTRLETFIASQASRPSQLEGQIARLQDSVDQVQEVVDNVNQPSVNGSDVI